MKTDNKEKLKLKTFSTSKYSRKKQSIYTTVMQNDYSEQLLPTNQSRKVTDFAMYVPLVVTKKFGDST